MEVKAVVSFYDGKTYEKVAWTTEDIGKLSYKEGANGSLSGEIDIYKGINNSDFLESLKEGSHLVSLDLQDELLFLGVVEDAFTDSDVCSVKFIGFLEVLDKIHLISSYKYGDFGELTKISEGDKSWEKTFYADSSEALLFEIMNNLEETMETAGYKRFWEWSDNTLSIISSKVRIEDDWKKTYNLNSAEFPTVKSILEDIIKTPDSEKFDVMPIVEDGIAKWKIGWGYRDLNLTLDSSIDPIHDITPEYSGLKSRAYSLAKGRDEEENVYLSKIPFDSNSFFSSYIPEDTEEKGLKAVDTVNRNNIANLNSLKGQLSFKTQEPRLCYLSATIDMKAGAHNLKLIVDEIEYSSEDNEEKLFTVSCSILEDQETFITKAIRPHSTLSRAIREPLDISYKNSRKSVFGENSSTGWRKL